MCGCLLLFKSLTHAQRASKLLEKNGISTLIGRPPREINESSCGYSVTIKEHFLHRALEILKDVELLKFKVYVCSTDGTYRERTE